MHACTCVCCMVSLQVIACPHLGASTVEAQLRVATEIAEQIVETSQGKSLKGIVSGESNFMFSLAKHLATHHSSSGPCFSD